MPPGPAGIASATLVELRSEICRTDRHADPEAVVDLPATPARPRRHLRKGVAAAVALTALGNGAAAAAGLLFPDRGETSGIDCRVAGQQLLISAVTSDPVADCTTMLKQQGVRVPGDLAAFHVPGQAVIVAPRSAPPAGGRPFTADEAPDVRVIELSSAVDDTIAGVGMDLTCRSPQTVTRFVRATLNRVGLPDWTITPPPKGERCVWAQTDVTRHAVRLLPMREAPETPLPIRPGEPDPIRLQRDLRALRKRCLTLPEAEAEVRTAARAANIPLEPGRIVTNVVPAYRCTFVYLIPAGGLDVRLCGPR